MSEQQKDSPLEQLAQRFAVYGSDQLASMRWSNTKADKDRRVAAASLYASVAAELRTIEAQLREQDRQLLLCSISTGLPVAE